MARTVSRPRLTSRATRPPRTDGVTATEQQVFDAVERLLERVTAHELSVAQILTEADVSRGTFYHYFSSKWDVIIALAGSVVDEILDRTAVVSDADGDLPSEAALWRSVNEGAGVFAEHRGVLRAIVENWREIPELRARWLEMMEHFTVEMAAQIDRDRAAGLAPAGPPSITVATTLLWSCVNTMYLAGLGQFAALPDERAAVDSLVRIWHGAIFGGGGEGGPPRGARFVRA